MKLRDLISRSVGRNALNGRAGLRDYTNQRPDDRSSMAELVRLLKEAEGPGQTIAHPGGDRGQPDKEHDPSRSRYRQDIKG